MSSHDPGARPLEMQRLLIVRQGAMGDVIHTLPAAAALRSVFPKMTFGWVVEERWAELLCAPGYPRCGPRGPQRPLVDSLHVVNTRAWRHALLSDRTWREIVDSVHEIRAQKYDVALDFQGAFRSSAIAKMSGARAICGFAWPREHAATLFYTRQVEARGAHIVVQNLSLASAMARVDLPPSPALFPENEAAAQQAFTTVTRRHMKQYAIVNPGAGWGAKQWPWERYAEVAHRLAAETGMESLINYGPGEEKLAWDVQKSSNGTAHPVTCSISELIALTRHAKLFIGGDTGPLHLAAALGIPVVAIFGPTDPARNGPFGTQSVVLRSSLSPTTHARRKQPDRGILQITSDDVLAAAQQLLKEDRG